MTTTRWQFETIPSRARQAQVVIAVFGRGPLGEGEPLDARVGRTITRAADPRWFDQWRTGSLRAIAEADLGARLAALDEADHVHLIAIEVAAPRDLGYLQEAWAIARRLVARGAAVLLDVQAMRYLEGRALPPADAPLDVAREVRRVFEASSQRPDQAHALHTRGMRKFGAPDSIALCSEPDTRLVGHALGRLAEAVALGVELAVPRHAVEVAPGLTWYVVEDEHGLGELLQLNNRARVVVDEQGHDLVGVLGRLPRGTE